MHNSHDVPNIGDSPSLQANQRLQLRDIVGAQNQRRAPERSPTINIQSISSGPIHYIIRHSYTILVYY